MASIFQDVLVYYTSKLLLKECTLIQHNATLLVTAMCMAVIMAGLIFLKPEDPTKKRKMAWHLMTCATHLIVAGMWLKIYNRLHETEATYAAQGDVAGLYGQMILEGLIGGILLLVAVFTVRSQPFVSFAYFACVGLTFLTLAASYAFFETQSTEAAQAQMLLALGTIIFTLIWLVSSIHFVVQFIKRRALVE